MEINLDVLCRRRLEQLENQRLEPTEKRWKVLLEDAPRKGEQDEEWETGVRRPGPHRTQYAQNRCTAE